MSGSKKQLSLTFFFGGIGWVGDSWRRPDSGIERARTLDYHRDIARAAEAAKLDALFIADSVNVDPASVVNPFHIHEPLTLLSVIGGLTSRIGLVPTISTTFSEPYNVARYLASLHTLTGGRVGWNVVTSSAGERNFGLAQLPSPEERYERADEYVAVVRKLWQSWPAGAVVVDREAGRWADPDRVRRIAHEGRHFRVEGPLNTPGFRDGDDPVLLQAGSSGLGKELAAKYAEAIYIANPGIDEALAYARDLRARLPRYGREASDVKILTGASMVIARTDGEAQEIYRAISEKTDYAAGLKKLEAHLGGISLGDIDPSDPIPVARIPDVSSIRGRQGRFEIFRRLAVDDRLPLGTLVQRVANSTGHFLPVGSPQTIAGIFAEWLEKGATDGFNLSYAHYPEQARLIFEELVPLLQERGLFRREYTADTLRGHLGSKPAPFYEG